MCDSVSDQDISKSSLPFSIKFCRTLSYHQREVKFEFEKNCIVKTQIAAKNMLNEVLKSVSRRLKEFVCKLNNKVDKENFRSNKRHFNITFLDK